MKRPWTAVVVVGSARIVLALAVCTSFQSLGTALADTNGRLSIGNVAPGASMRYQEAFYENQPLGVRGQRFETLTVVTDGPTKAKITLEEFDGSKRTYDGHVAVSGAITVDDKSACGAFDGYNFVANVIHAAPAYIDESTTWKTSVPVQFTTTCDTSLVPVTVTVERAEGDVRALNIYGRVVKKIGYEGSLSIWSIELHLHMVFLGNRFVQFDGTADNVLDSVKGHSAWSLSVEPRTDGM